MVNKAPLSRFERLARSFFESSIDKLLGARGLVRNISEQLVVEMETNYEDNRRANRYEVYIHPADLNTLQAHDLELSRRLAKYLAEAADMADLKLPEVPAILFRPDPNLSTGNLYVTSSWFDGIQQHTKVLRAHRSEHSGRSHSSPDAYLIVNGRHHLVLNEAKYTLGRHLENDIVLEDPSVSRRHAQIQWDSEGFIIFDLSSSVGTYVNGTRITSRHLIAGDVLTLGTVSLIYGEESGTDHPVLIDEDRHTEITKPLKPRDGA